MLRNALVPSFKRLRGFYSGAAHASTLTRTRCSKTGCSAAVVATTTAVFWWCLSNNPVRNEAPSPIPSKRVNSTGVDENGVLCTVVWGSNKSNLIDPQSPGTDSFQTPVNVQWLENTALRDMALHETHAACVDVRGDVFQWGNGFFGSKSGSKTPKVTLRGKYHQGTTDGLLVYALSASGRVYVLAANEERQKLPEQRTSSTAPRWISGWLGREQENTHFAEIHPKEKLNWGEIFVSIAGGTNHLLALTSEGRTFAHPINKDANSHGQLGLQNIEVPMASSSSDGTGRSCTDVELTTRPTVSSYTNIPPPPPTIANGHGDVSDVHRNRYSDTLYEIPSLRGIKVSKIAAGNRSSFVTSSGRVLGWGANEHGQIGLGSAITLDAITVPTEINLNRNVPVSTKSRCLDIVAGGDLTCLVVERDAGDSRIYVDILSCGNGRWGGLGNGSFSTFQGNPGRVKNVSGLREYDDLERRLSPIVPHNISVSPTGHVLLTLDTQSRAGPGGSGRDLAVWGLNHDYQLGDGKRSSLNAPTTLDRPEGGRFILSKRKATVRDMSGKVWKKGAEVEQCAVAGYSNSVVYWKIKL